MNDGDHEKWLDFLEGRVTGAEAETLLRELEENPTLADHLRSAARGLEGVRALVASPVPMATSGRVRRFGGWTTLAAVVASIALAVPVTWTLASRSAESQTPRVSPVGAPVNSDPSFMLVLHGTWPDASTVSEEERMRRAQEYWAWTSELAERDVLIAAGDLRWEPGQRLGSGGAALQVSTAEVETPEFMVGMYALRLDSYEDAVALAQECPHLRYGGAVSVRRVAAGFVTAAAGDWGP